MTQNSKVIYYWLHVPFVLFLVPRTDMVILLQMCPVLLCLDLVSKKMWLGKV
jgi:hypothetical protein